MWKKLCQLEEIQEWCSYAVINTKEPPFIFSYKVLQSIAVTNMRQIKQG